MVRQIAYSIEIKSIVLFTTHIRTNDWTGRLKLGHSALLHFQILDSFHRLFSLIHSAHYTHTEQNREKKNVANYNYRKIILHKINSSQLVNRENFFSVLITKCKRSRHSNAGHAYSNKYHETCVFIHMKRCMILLCGRLVLFI